MVQLSRRALFGAAPLLALAPALSPVAFGDSLSRGAFTHGVASGDPTASAVILWTRFVPADGAARGTIRWEIAADDAFQNVAQKGDIHVDATTDWCAKVDAAGLESGRRYFYRFVGADAASPTGLTRTAPTGPTESLTFALFSCSNKPFGYFHAYAHAAARDEIDICFHVGDYIYEYARGTYPAADALLPDRVIEPANEIVSLSDYHARYGSYRTDPHLQEIHRVKPFLCVWDDHELTNDTWMDGAQNHQPETEGEWSVRRAAAAKAYADWMPMRPTSSPLMIYRQFEWGDLASLLMLDTRLIGRDKQLDWRGALGPAMAEGESAFLTAADRFARTELANPRRSLLGAQQEAWLQEALTRSKARGAAWQVLAQQLVMGNQVMPANLARLLPAGASEQTKQWIGAGAAIGKIGIGWSLDSWSGYGPARERLLAACAQHGTNALVLSGDSHNTWFNDLKVGDRMAAIEMAGGSVSSPGMENTFTGAAPGAREAAIKDANPLTIFSDATHRGYATAKLTRAGVVSEWVALSTVRSVETPTAMVTTLSAEARAEGGPSGWAV